MILRQDSTFDCVNIAHRVYKVVQLQSQSKYHDPRYCCSRQPIRPRLRQYAA